jgi:crotonobetainyl-CoA:carnitine CoA-transferase CaiB-like acyl-CoA transferase
MLSRQGGQWDVVNTPGRALHDVDAAANGYTQRFAHENGDMMTLVSAPVQFDGEAARLTRAPLLGADTNDVLTRLGLSADELSRLRQAGTIGRAPSTT